MANKQKLKYILLATVVFAFIIFAVFMVYKTFFNKNQTAQNSSTVVSNDGAVKQLNPTQSESISLNNNTNKDPNALSVKEPTELSSNLGSGQQKNTSGSNSSSTSSGVPGPETFGAFEKYAKDENVLYQDLQIGNGPEVSADSQVAVLYKGYLTSGKLFDQSRAGSDGKLQPFIFSPAGGQVIAGFAQGTVGAKQGGVRRIIVPPALGYGQESQNGIPANSVLVFDVQIVSVQ